MIKNNQKDIWIKDPIHGFLEFTMDKDSLFLALLDTPELQRLRRIRQLGTISFVFPGAEHSRFTHALGTYATAKNTLNHFRQRELIDKNLSYQELEIPILVAALLHDVGHGPFSHNFELITGIDHERFTKAIISQNTQINKILKSFTTDLPDKVISLLEHRFPIPLGNSMISSQLDMDRLDYICRDSYMTGANYGFVDIQRIISILTIYNNEMVILEKGMGTIEEYLIARFYMYWEVYFHKTASGLALMLEKIFLRAQIVFKEKADKWTENLESRFHFLFHKQETEDISESNLNDFLSIDDHDLYFLLKRFSQGEDKILRDLSQRFLNRQVFKPIPINESNQAKREKNFLNTDTEEQALKREKLREILKESLIAKGLDPTYYLLEQRLGKAIYTPNPIDSDSNNKDGQKIKILKNNAQLTDIANNSIIISKLVQVNYHQKEVFFAPKEIRDQISTH